MKPKMESTHGKAWAREKPRRKIPCETKPPDSQSQNNVSAKAANHILHLYTPKVDKYAIHGAFLASVRKGEEAIYVTADNPKSSIRESDFSNAKLRIIRPEDLRDLKVETGKMRFIIDAGSFSEKERIAEIMQRESYINVLGKRHCVSCLCTYDVSKLDPETVKHLGKHHNMLRLTTSDLTVLSGDLFVGTELSGESVERMVKDNLETIILAILQKKPMCGTEMIEAIHIEFNVLLSPGTIYPLLHSLTDRRLLTFKKQGKAKTYTLDRMAEPKIRRLVNEQIQARTLLNHYLRQATTP